MHREVFFQPLQSPFEKFAFLAEGEADEMARLAIFEERAQGNQCDRLLKQNLPFLQVAKWVERGPVETIFVTTPSCC